MSNLKQRLYDELLLKAEIGQEGVNFDPSVFANLKIGSEHQEQVHCLFEYDTDTHEDFELPPYIVLPLGLITLFNYTKRSPNRIESDGKAFYIVRRDGTSFPISFTKRPSLLPAENQ